MKLLDVLGNPQVAIHSPTLEPPRDDPSTFGELGQRGIDTGWIHERHPFSMAKDPTSFISHADAPPI
jgi:hypothetical protein